MSEQPTDEHPNGTCPPWPVSQSCLTLSCYTSPGCPRSRAYFICLIIPASSTGWLQRVVMGHSDLSGFCSEDSLSLILVEWRQCLSLFSLKTYSHRWNILLRYVFWKEGSLKILWGDTCFLSAFYEVLGRDALGVHRIEKLSLTSVSFLTDVYKHEIRYCFSPDWPFLSMNSI